MFDFYFFEAALGYYAWDRSILCKLMQLRCWQLVDKLHKIQKYQQQVQGVFIAGLNVEDGEIPTKKVKVIVKTSLSIFLGRDFAILNTFWSRISKKHPVLYYK